MPTPREDENRDDFIARCMSDDEAVLDFPDTAQRLAFCERTWEEEQAQNGGPMTLAIAQHQRTAEPIRDEELFGRNHFVVPAVAVREQVLSNNVGRMYLPAEEIQRSVDAWNFVPVTIDHPRKRGRPTTARQQDVLNSQAIGLVLNARVEEGALKVDVFIDPEQAANVEGGEKLIAQLERGEVGEVSTGFRFDAENRQGTYEGERFELIARNLQPDHFAVGIEEGACSVQDGCGIGVNEEDDVEEEKVDVVAESIWGRLKAFITEEEEMSDEEQEAAPDNEAVNDEPDEVEAANEDADTEESHKTPEWASNLVDKVEKIDQRLDEVEEAAEPALNEYEQKRNRFVSEIAQNSPFDEDDLEGESLERLKKLKSMTRAENYAGRGAPKADASELPELDFEVSSPYGTDEE